MEEQKTPETQTSQRNNWGFWKFIFYSLIVLACVSTISLRLETPASDISTDDYSFKSTENYDCNVQGILVRGFLDTYPEYYEDEDGEQETITASENVVYAIQEAETNDSIDVILIEIDSYGGSPVAAEEIEAALKNSSKPSIAHIRSLWLSAAYWAATGADVIFASKNSFVWSIGATSSYVDHAEKNAKEGLRYNQISSGKFKDSWSPNKALSEEEKALLQRDVDMIAESFIWVVSKNRNIPLVEVESLADGSGMLWSMALEAKLIDKIWWFFEVEDYIKKEYSESKICW